MGISNIEWTDFVFNPWLGCQHVSPGCINCYAETLMDKRYHRVEWGPHGERKRTSESYWRQPLSWARKARHAQEDFDVGLLTIRPHRPRVFCASLADVWDNQVPQEWRVDLFKLIAATPELDWLLLTKRPENIEKMLESTIKDIGLSLRNPPNIKPHGLQWPWPNVWLGFTAENQAHFHRRWRIMREIPAAVRFCSYEPALGPLRLTVDVAGDLHWLICGGESGAGYRPMDMEWEHGIREDCQRAGVSYFFKQMAGKKPMPANYPVVRQFPVPRV